MRACVRVSTICVVGVYASTSLCAVCAFACQWFVLGVCSVCSVPNFPFPSLCVILVCVFFNQGEVDLERPKREKIMLQQVTKQDLAVMNGSL